MKNSSLLTSCATIQTWSELSNHHGAPRPAANLHECTAAEAYEATDGKCIFVGGCRSPPFEHNGKDAAEYVFPGLALGMTIAEGTRARIHPHRSRRDRR